MTAVVAILGIIALVAMPNLSPLRPQKLDLAASLVADAIRYSRAEAIRTGRAHGVTISRVTQLVTVKSYDLTATPVNTLAILNHPISKQPYEFNINQSPATSGVSISSALGVFVYKVVGRRDSLIFDAGGVPIWIVTPLMNSYLLDDGDIELSLGSDLRRVRVAALTGRVTFE